MTTTFVGGVLTEWPDHGILRADAPRRDIKAQQAATSRVGELTAKAGTPPD
jgi:hypothetical protein